MKRFAVLAAAGFVGVFGLGSAAQAFSVVNQDGQAHVLKITEGDSAREVRLEAKQQADGLCSTLCNVVLDDSEEAYEVAANENLLIEEGLLLIADAPGDDQSFDGDQAGEADQYVDEEMPADEPVNVDTE